MARKLWLIGLTLALSLCVVGTTAWAGAVLHIGDPPNTGTYLFGSEVRPIGDTSLGILENGNGNPLLDDPLKLIIGVPDDSFSAPSINWVDGSASGSASATSGGLFSSGEVYSFLGLSGGNNSNSFGNWAAADLAVNGLTVSGFDIFYYNINGSGITGGKTIDVTFASALPVGTFAVAYGEYTGGAGPTKIFSTPFTESGMVPEPSTLLLLGSGLIGLAGFGRKKHKM